MKKTLAITVFIIGLAGVSFLAFKQPIKDFAYWVYAQGMFVTGDVDEFNPGSHVGDKFPPIKAMYRDAVISSLEGLEGTNGTVFVASRSFEWCPYCMRQLIQLDKNKQKYLDAGINIVAMTYDSPQVQHDFVRRHAITVPVLSDINAQSFNTLGILSPEYSPGDEHYGLPYPGMIVINTEGVIVGKLFVEAYSKRVDAESALDYALSVL